MILGPTTARDHEIGKKEGIRVFSSLNGAACENIIYNFRVIKTKITLSLENNFVSNEQ